jgi:hypothetical protein
VPNVHPAVQLSAVKAMRGGDQQTHEDFEILDEKLVYSGWRTITQRKIRMRNGKVADFDVSYKNNALPRQ